jgi:SAM-dependent methyltransferase
MHASAQLPVESGFESVNYVSGRSFEQFILWLKSRHSRLYQIIDSKCRWESYVRPEICKLNELSWEFEQEGEGGRGNDYNRAQRNVDNRRTGMTRLLQLFGPGNGQLPGAETLILDALAGDGTLRRFAERFGDRRPEIVSADMSRLMVERCIAQGYPCIRQSAAKSFLADGTLDGVLIAYGSHHLSADERRAAAAEAFRTLKPGGKFVLHDFETGGGVDRWFRMVVDPYSATGHPHPHFSMAEMEGLMRGAGFRRVSVFAMEDPFTVEGASASEAHRNMLRHLHMMYGLVKLPITDAGGLAKLEALARDTMGQVRVETIGDRFEATLMRHALVAVGVK